MPTCGMIAASTYISGFIDFSQDYVTAEQPFPDTQSNVLTIQYTDGNGDVKTLYSNTSFVFERLKTHVLEFSLPEMINSGIQTSLKDDISDSLTEIEWQ